MGFATVTHKIQVSRKKLVELLVDGVPVDCPNTNGDTVWISVPSNHSRSLIDRTGKPRMHEFQATVVFGGHTFNRAKVILFTYDYQHYTGGVEYDKYPDDNMSE